MNGYPFADPVRAGLRFARDEASVLKHEYIGTEHLLLGILKADGGAARALEALSVSIPELRQRVLTVIKPGKAAETDRELPYTSRSKKVLELAMVEAREFEHMYIGTEHILLGLVREKMGVGAQVLAASGVTAERLLPVVARLVGAAEGDPPPAPVG